MAGPIGIRNDILARRRNSHSAKGVINPEILGRRAVDRSSEISRQISFGQDRDTRTRRVNGEGYRVSSQAVVTSRDSGSARPFSRYFAAWHGDVRGLRRGEWTGIGLLQELHKLFDAIIGLKAIDKESARPLAFIS